MTEIPSTPSLKISTALLCTDAIEDKSNRIMVMGLVGPVEGADILVSEFGQVGLMFLLFSARQDVDSTKEIVIEIIDPDKVAMFPPRKSPMHFKAGRIMRIYVRAAINVQKEGLYLFRCSVESQIVFQATFRIALGVASD